METTVFTVFREVEMEYLALKSQAFGDQIQSTKTIKGIFKLRTGETSVLNAGLLTANATAHVHPEDFTDSELVGNGIRYNGQTYEIVGLTEGRNFETNVVEHLTLTLQRLKAVESGDDYEIDD